MIKPRKQTAQVLNIKTSNSQERDPDADEDGFIAPMARRKGKAHLSKFFA